MKKGNEEDKSRSNENIGQIEEMNDSQDDTENEDNTDNHDEIPEAIVIQESSKQIGTTSTAEISQLPAIMILKMINFESKSAKSFQKGYQNLKWNQTFQIFSTNQSQILLAVLESFKISRSKNSEHCLSLIYGLKIL